MKGVYDFSKMFKNVPGCIMDKMYLKKVPV